MRFVKTFLALSMLPAMGHAQFLPNIGVSPTRVAVGSGIRTFTISGIDLKPGLQVYWNGQTRPTTFVSQWNLKVQIPSSDLEQPGLARISLWDPDQNARVSTESPILIYLPLQTWDLVSDPVRARLYASVSQADANGPSVAVIDPAKGIVERYLPMPAEPGVMALTSGSRYLYVAMKDRIRRLDPAGDGSGVDVPITGSVSILPLPGDGTSFVVANQSNSAFVFDGSTPRPNQSNNAPRCLVAANGSALYGGPGFRLLRLGANGLPFSAEVDIETLLGGRGCPVSAAGLLYGSNGDIVDPASVTRLGRFGAYGLVDVAPERGKAYFLGFESSPGIVNPAAVNLMVFDLESRSLLSSTYLPAGLTSYSGRLVHWGTDGLAFGDFTTVNTTLANGLYLLHAADLK